MRFIYKKMKDMFEGINVANKEEATVAIMKKMLFGAFAGFRWYPSPFKAPGFFRHNPDNQMELYFFEHSLITKAWPSISASSLEDVSVEVCMSYVTIPLLVYAPPSGAVGEGEVQCGASSWGLHEAALHH